MCAVCAWCSCRYDITKEFTPRSYHGPDLLIEASEKCNETRFFQDPRWTKRTHQHGALSAAPLSVHSPQR